ncbi:aspartate carbamoyltransferase regulatory subunit [Methanotorris formicicus]|uniref:Aspartate carbamoyltransferase regulatory chain n=1 Tax=Methanotorris formicicus Mc-S-70 TaxID=647171 RepID=H1KZG8_9EURY|nr:aspartate carbamoyltransferase regulatory subunit [Methanotorris formicicus]EHP85976.1 aspartate carbamoyltransferase, regulatory subunit [Methanotorris formicicus Mc-S-70]
MKNRELKVKPIQNGTVIDHIKSGKALDVYNILKISDDLPIMLAMNVPSKKMGKKDILKIEGLELDSDDVNKIALIAPDATINIIRNGVVVEKFKVNIPNYIEGLLKCTNPNCITNRENVEGKFIIESKNPLKIRCKYCEKFLSAIIYKK